MLVAQLLFLLLVTGPALTPLYTQRWYGVILFLCALMGLGAGRGWRLVGATLAGVLVVVSADSQQRGVGVVLAGGRLADTIVARVSQELDRVPPGRDGVFVTGLPGAYYGVPLFWYGFENAVNPPFRSREAPAPVYPVHRNLHLGPGAPWPLHPPVEALLYASGRDTVQMVVKIDQDLDVNVETRDLVTTYPRKEVEERIAALFSDRRLLASFVGDPPAVLGYDAGELTVQVAAADLDRVEVFLFVPGKDFRICTAVEGPNVLIDLWKYIEDVAFLRGVVTEVHILPVGFGSVPGQVVLGPVLSFRCAPKVQRDRWLNR